MRQNKNLPRLDMNPMVDMAFLLVCFFMMTTTFKSEMPVDIAIPFSRAEIKVPDKNICVITIDKSDRVFFGLDNKYDRKQMLRFIAGQNELTFSREQVERFSLLSNFGVSMKDLSELLLLEKNERKAYYQTGIPFKESQNELRQWLIASRLANPHLKFAINGDADVSANSVKKIIDIMQDLNITRFNLITDKMKDVTTS